MIKEYCENAHIVIIRADTYGSQLSMLEAFYTEALEDFPNLTREDCKVVHYAGRRYKGYFGIEFESKYCPDNYERVSNLEDTL